MLQRLRRRMSGTMAVMWLIGLAIVALVVIGSVKTLVKGTYGADMWVNTTIYGIAQGGIYALIALGYTLGYGILRMINFAHSEVFMAGPFIGFFVADAFDRAGLLNRQPAIWPILCLLVVLLVAIVVSTVIAVLLERIAYRPLRRAPRLVPLITAIGASYFLQYTFMGMFGSNPKGWPEIQILKGRWPLGNWPLVGEVTILKTQAVVIVAAVLILAALYVFVRRTKTGKAMQAVSEDKDTSALMGIDVDRIIVITFVVGGALAGAAGFFYALLFRGATQFNMGFFPGIKAFTAAVLGGIGNVVGAMLGGMFLGIAESLVTNLVLDGWGIPAPYQLKDALAFVLLVLVLIFRPSGILGERLAAKKA